MHRAVKKLQKQPNHFQSAEVLKEAFHQINQKSLDDIEVYKNLNTAESWENVYYKYNEIIGKQKQIKNLDLLNPVVQFTDYSNELNHAQQRAAELYFQRGLDIFESAQSKSDYQAAHLNFNRVNSISPNFNNVTQLIAESKTKGTYLVLITVENPKNLALPEEFLASLTAINQSRLNDDWMIFKTTYQPGDAFDFSANLIIEGFFVGPDNLNTKKYNEEKEVIVSYKIAKDPKGNIIKDEKGHVIKTPVYETRKASVVESIRTKESYVKAKLQLIDNFTLNTFKEINVIGTYKFESSTATVKGSTEALSKQTLSLTKQKLRPYPSYKTMLLEAGNDLRSNFYLQLRINRKEFK